MNELSREEGFQDAEDETQGEKRVAGVEAKAKRKAGWMKLPRDKRVAIRRLHQMMGRCSAAALARIRMFRGCPRRSQTFSVLSL